MTIGEGVSQVPLPLERPGQNYILIWSSQKLGLIPLGVISVVVQEVATSRFGIHTLEGIDECRHTPHSKDPRWVVGPDALPTNLFKCDPCQVPQFSPGELGQHPSPDDRTCSCFSLVIITSGNWP